MARMQPELRKQELIEIAFKQFLEQGYEKTSIRSIVAAAKGEIGMFYHHFVSKEEIFQAVLEQYNNLYIKKIKQNINTRKESSLWGVLGKIVEDLEKALSEYTNLNHGAANTQVLMILHQNTLMSLRPIFCELLEDHIRRGEISPPKTDISLLTDFLLFGTSAVIHDKEIKSAANRIGGS